MNSQNIIFVIIGCILVGIGAILLFIFKALPLINLIVEIPNSRKITTNVKAKLPEIVCILWGEVWSFNNNASTV